MSIETIGMSALVMRFMMSLNVSRTGGLKLNPKSPSTIRRYLATVRTSGHASRKGISIKVHWVTKSLKRGLSVLF